MLNINDLTSATLNLIPGNTPLQKHDNMKRIAKLLNDLSFPKRGSEAENADAAYFINMADEILKDGPIEIPKSGV